MASRELTVEGSDLALYRTRGRTGQVLKCRRVLVEGIGEILRVRNDGTVNVLLNGVMLVQGNLAPQTISYAGPSSGSTPPYGLLIGGANQQVPTSGTLGGLFNALNTTIPEYQTKLNSVASSLVSLVNGQQESGAYLLPTTSGGSTTYTTNSAATMPIFDPLTVSAG